MTLPPSAPRPADPRTRGPGPREAAAPEDGTEPAGEDVAAAVDAAMAGLDGLADRPLTEHVAVFERIHAALGDALAAAPAAGETPGRV